MAHTHAHALPLRSSFRTALRENVEACGRASLATVASAAAAIELHCAETCSGKAQYLAKMRTAHAKLGALTKAGNSFLMLVRAAAALVVGACVCPQVTRSVRAACSPL